MRILFVALPDSIHAARWIAQVSSVFETHLYPSSNASLHQEMPTLTFHKHFAELAYKLPHIKYEAIYTTSGHDFFSKVMRKVQWEYIYRTKQEMLSETDSLLKVIDKVKPDIIHSLETQAAGYKVLEAKKSMGNNFPIWFHSNWGSDIYLFARLKEHQNRIKEVLQYCDFYFCECKRDMKIAQSYGWQGEPLPVFPNSGGIKIDEIQKMRNEGAISKRRVILLKGYQNWAGRALVGLRALERCQDLLKGYEIVVYSSYTEDVSTAIELFAQNTNIPITAYPKYSPHREILNLHSKARISIGLSISDAISTSLLEAMAMGSFPIQSHTSCADEWIIDGETGLLVPPDDVEIIEQAIRKALTDDELVDKASLKNYQTIVDRLEYSKIQQQTIQMYHHIYNQKINKK